VLDDGQSVTSQNVSDAVLLSYTATEMNEKNKAIFRRQAAVPVFGNLTMIHYGVNRSVQNREFEVKRRELFEHSNLQLNRSLTAIDHWNEATIQKRSETLFEHAVKIWGGPST
jgi:hypothetical protein